MTTIITFPLADMNERVSYGPWSDSCVDFALSKRKTSAKYGLVASLFTDEEYKAIQPPATLAEDGTLSMNPPEVFKYLDHPGTFPDEQKRQAQHKHNLEMYNLQVSDIREIKEAMISSLPLSVIALMIEPGFARMMNRTPQFIYHFMKVKYGTPTPHELKIVRAEIEQPWCQQNSSFTEHIAKHKQVHNTLKNNNEILTESIKVERFRSSLLDSAIFNEALSAYNRQYPTVILQTFENVCASMQIEIDNRDLVGTVSSNGYVNSVVTVPKNQAKTYTQAEVDALVVAGTASSVIKPNYYTQTEVDNILAMLKNSQGTSRMTVNQNKTCYCFTHGTCKHNSRDCKAPAANHQVTATYRNQMGGKKST